MKEDLVERLTTELNTYMNDLSRRDAAEVIVEAYALVIKQEIVAFFYAADDSFISMVESAAKKVLPPNASVLDWLYDLYITDSSANIHTVVDDCLTQGGIGEELRRINADSERNCTE